MAISVWAEVRRGRGVRVRWVAIMEVQGVRRACRAAREPCMGVDMRGRAMWSAMVSTHP